MPFVEGVLLAAGESRRMGFPKPLLPLGNTTFIERLCETLLAELPRLLVVLGAYAQQVRAKLPQDNRIVVVENRDYALGQLSSLKVAVRACDPQAWAILVHLVDQPFIRRETVAAVVKAYNEGAGPIVIARWRGKRGHPVLFDRALFPELLSAAEDQGARAVVHKDPGRVAYVDVEDEGVVLDLDSPEDLARAGVPYPLDTARR